SAGCGRSPATRQNIKRPHTLVKACFTYPLPNATINASGPPATIAYKATQTVAAGPSQAPRAAISLTSPPPIPRSAKNGRNINRPTAQPPADQPREVNPPVTR